MKFTSINKTLLLILFVILIIACTKKNSNMQVDGLTSYSAFNGSYSKTFDDLQDLHMSAAIAKGIKPMRSRADTIQHLDKLILLPTELDIYKVDKLTHSVPYLIPDASQLISQIGYNFKDSLRRKQLPPYKIIITSVTRTQDDVDRLTKRNRNASENSTHCYGTTFDISWRRFVKQDSLRELSNDKLKFVLAQVLNDLRERNKCYVTYERKQACFHITVR